MGTRLNPLGRERSRSRQPVCGIALLVNPLQDNHDVISPEEDPVERDYLGRLLHVADRALRRAKSASRRTRRSRPLD